MVNQNVEKIQIIIVLIILPFLIEWNDIKQHHNKIVKSLLPRNFKGVFTTDPSRTFKYWHQICIQRPQKPSSTKFCENPLIYLIVIEFFVNTCIDVLDSGSPPSRVRVYTYSIMKGLIYLLFLENNVLHQLSYSTRRSTGTKKDTLILTSPNAY